MNDAIASPAAQLKIAADEAEISNRKPSILIVDDEEYNLDILEKHLHKAGYVTTRALDGVEAWRILTQEGDHFDTVLLDRMMPEMGGMEVLEKIKQHGTLQNIPVIMQTAAVGAQEAVEGIEAGAYYYVTKPYSAEVVVSIVDSAVREYRQFKLLRNQLTQAINIHSLMTRADFTLKTLEEAREVAIYLSRMSPKPDRDMVSLTSLIINGIEHGNLGIGYARKHDLLLAGTWEDEITHLLQEPENREKKVRVVFERLDSGLQVTIQDNGEGFNWQEYMDFEPRRITDPNGRGIAMANMMNPGNVLYQGNGNCVIYRMNSADEA